MDELARKYVETHDRKIKEGIEALAREVIKLGEPWVSVGGESWASVWFTDTRQQLKLPPVAAVHAAPSIIQK